MLNKTKLILCHFTILYNFIFGNPSEGVWKQFLYTDGISSNYTFDVYKDKQGRVWVGTQNGITLIDGSITKKYGVAHGLPSADIIKITDINGRLFAATSGQGVYVLENDTFEKVKFVKGSNVTTMENIGDKIFISTNLENIMYDGYKTSFMDKGFPNAKIIDVFSNGKNDWFASNQSLIKLEGNKYVSEKITFSSSNAKIQALLIDGDIEYFGTNQGLWSRQNNRNAKLIKNINVLSLDKTSDGLIIVGAKKGFYYLNKGFLKKITLDGQDYLSLSKTAVRDIEVTSENEIWYATFGMGLLLHDPGTFTNINSKNGLDVGGMTFDLERDGDRVYIATKNGLFIYKKNKIEKHFTKKDGLPSNMILDLDLDSKGDLWIATANGLSKLSGSVFKNYSRRDGLPSKLVTSVHVDKRDDSRIWIGSERSGLTRFDEKGFYTFAVQDGLPSNSIRDITQLSNGTLIIACYKAGVAKFDGKKFTLYDNGLDDKRVILLENGFDGEVWAGTESAGIGVLEEDQFRMIRDSDGLAHNEMFSLYNDGEKMWAGTFGGGVSCFHENTWFTLRESDGLNSNTVGSIVSIDENTTMIGGTSGISIFKMNNQKFSLEIRNILTPGEELSFDKQMEPISGILKDRFTLTPNPMVYNPSDAEIKFRYRTKKISDPNFSGWSNLSVSPQISYVPQDVGSFQLQVQAVDNRIAFSEIITIPFNIGRVWYLDPKTAIPFWGSIMLLIGFSTVTYINYRKKSKEAEELREAEIERQQAEMEEAREFQQAMLPSEMPITDDYEMVGFQKTATEVGGDFFDFMQKEDGRWVAICGDATGHGLTSGNVVSITKTAMSSLVEEDPVPTLDSLNKTLLSMNIGLNRMCLNIASIGEDSIRFSSAGMPPAYYYSAEKSELEEILVGALPLGSFKGAIHTEQEVAFKNSGDILIMMSDGLPEAENSKNEMVGYERTLDLIKTLSDKSAEEIKDGLVEMCDNWLGDTAELQDDMTFVIIKKR